MNLKQLMKQETITLNKKNTLQNLMSNLFKTIVVGRRSNLIVKGKIDNN
ncbi:hypothetical protein [Neobacillus niacini]|nr:hypothetical protein [Neobacillus niacini]